MHDDSAARRILITGANGYVGRHLVAGLSEDYLVTAGVRAMPAAEAATVSYRPYGDIGDIGSWAPVLEDIDVVIHTAGIVHQPKGAVDAARFQKVNVDATRQLVADAAAAGVQHVVYLSSISVYGTQDYEAPLTEASALAPTTDYGRSKRDAEEVVMRTADTHGVAWTILRPPMIYGSNAPGNFSRLARLIRSGMPLPFSGVRNQRSLLHIDHLVSMIHACLENTAAHRQVFLVADTEAVSTPELIGAMASGSGVRARLFWLPGWLLNALSKLPGIGKSVTSLVGTLVLDTGKARQSLSWQPSQSARDAIAASMGFEGQSTHVN